MIRTRRWFPIALALATLAAIPGGTAQEGASPGIATEEPACPGGVFPVFEDLDIVNVTERRRRGGDTLMVEATAHNPCDRAVDLAAFGMLLVARDGGERLWISGNNLSVEPGASERVVLNLTHLFVQRDFLELVVDRMELTDDGLVLAREVPYDGWARYVTGDRPNATQVARFNATLEPGEPTRLVVAGFSPQGETVRGTAPAGGEAAPRMEPAEVQLALLLR